MARSTPTPASKATRTTTSAASAPESVTPSYSTPSSQVPHEKIAQRAYEKWCQRGYPTGSHQQDWLEAEMELKAELNRPNTKGR